MLRRFAPWLLVLLPLIACKDKEERRWDTVSSATTASASAGSAPKTETGALNASFPKDGALGYKRVFTADKEGYAEAKLQKDGADVATISVSQADEAAKTKFKDSKDTVKTYPLVTFGKNQSSALVGNKFQVKVSSQTLDADARKAVLGEFDLDAIAKK